MVHPPKLPSFAHPHVVPTLYDFFFTYTYTHKYILKECLIKMVSVTIHFISSSVEHKRRFFFLSSQCWPKLFGCQRSSKLCYTEDRKSMKDMRAN